MANLVAFVTPTQMSAGLILPKRIPLSYSSAIAIIPPADAWSAIQSVRYELKDKGLFRWPPHSNIVYPSVPEKEFAELSVHLSEILADQQPFTVRLNSFEIFGRQHSATLWLKPDAEDLTALPKLYAAVNGAVENLLSPPSETRDGNDGLEDNSVHSSKEFVPHFTVSHYKSTAGAREARDALQERWQPVEFTVSSIDMIARASHESPFQLIRRIPLGGGEIEVFEGEGRPYVGMPDVPKPFMVPLFKDKKPNRKKKNGGSKSESIDEVKEGT